MSMNIYKAQTAVEFTYNVMMGAYITAAVDLCKRIKGYGPWLHYMAKKDRESKRIINCTRYKMMHN